MRILVVDDDPAQRETLHDVLTLHGHDVVTADSGLTAREVTEAVSPAVAIVDLRLPDTDGITLCGELRAQRTGLQTVVLTGNATMESAVAALRTAALDYLVKPVDPRTLCGVVNRAADRWRSAQIESELRRDHNRFRLLLDGLSEIVTVISPGGVIQYESGAVEPMLGREPAERIGTPLLDWVHHEDVAAVQTLLDTLDHTSNGTPHRAETRMQAQDGSWRTVELTANGSFTRPELDGFVLTTRDITDRKRLEAELRQSQKMEAIGQLTGGIAHEINNVLTIVLANGQSVFEHLDPDAVEMRRDVQDVMSAARQGATLVGKLLGFSRRQRLTKQTIEVGETVRQTLRMLRRMIPESVRVNFHPHSAPCCALADDGAIDQMIMNLVTNARDALPEGGTVTVRVEPVEIDEAFCETNPGATSGNYVCISVRDDGCGIAPEDVDHVFEPFYTTKLIAGGTGLGMAMVYGLMKQHNGYSQIESCLGSGTTVSLYLPACAAPDAERHQPAEPAERRALSELGGSETVLVVEDQANLLRAAKRVLQRHGYTVLTAPDGADALATLRKTPGGVDLVVADVVMPTMGGKALAAELRTWDEPPAILFTSGYSADDLRKGQLLDPDLPLLRKPWTVEELIDSVRAVLQARPGAPVEG